MASESRNWIAVKGLALASTFAVAATQIQTSAVIIPSLLRPLDSSQPSSPSQPPSRPTSSLRVPSSNDGRLTPQPSENKVFTFSLGSSGTYKAVAQQFAKHDELNFRVVPAIELANIALFGFSAYRARNVGNPVWTNYAAAAGLLLSVFPLTGVFMSPLVHKLRRLAGDEEKIEPYEDAPPDREMEKSNAVEFLTKWGYLNAARAGLILAASGFGLVAFALE